MIDALMMLAVVEDQESASRCVVLSSLAADLSAEELEGALARLDDVPPSPQGERLRRMLTALLELVAAARNEGTAPAPTPAEAGPVYIEDAAALLGVSRATLYREITKLPESERPASYGTDKRRRWFWPDREALLGWWTRIHAPPEPQKTRPPRPRAPRRAPATDGEGPVDWKALERELTGRA